VQLFDVSGTRLPDLGNPLLFESDGVTVLAREVRTGYAGWIVPVRAGTDAAVGRLSARVAGQAVAVACDIVMVPPPPPLQVEPGSLLVAAFGDPSLDEPATFRFVPRAADGNAVGSGVSFHFEIVGAEVEPILVHGASTYVGLGRYEIAVTPRLAGPVVVSAIGSDARTLASRTFFIPDPNGADSELVESGPEAIESGPEAVEPVEPSEPAPEPPEVAEDMSEDSETIDESDIGSGDASDVADVVGADAASDGTNDSADARTDPTSEVAADGDDLGESPDLSEPMPEPAAEPSETGDLSEAIASEPHPRGDEGCGSDPLLTPSLGLATALMLALRRRRELS